MSSRSVDNRLAVITVIAGAIGVVLLAGTPLLGAPLLAGALSVLVYAGRYPWALGALLAGIAFVAFSSTGSILFVVAASAALYFSVIALRTHPAVSVGVALAIALALAAGLSDVVGALLSGTSVVALMREMSAELVAALVEAYGQTATDSVLGSIELAVTSTVELLPSLYVVQGVVLSALSIWAVRWYSLRSGDETRIQPLGALDFSPHALWPLVFGLLATALSTVDLPMQEAIAISARNLIVCARIILFVQAVAVVSSYFSAKKVGPISKAAAYLLLMWLESLFWVMTVLGAADFWMNFRKLQRDDRSDGLEGSHTGT